MQNYLNSDYALNKHSEGIVYRFADRIVEVTLADYLAENPGKTENDFRALKAFSDSDYLNQSDSNYRQTWKDTPLDGVEESEIPSAPSPEEKLFADITARERAEARRERLEAAHGALDKLTEIQRRRYLLYAGKGLTIRQIADIEGAHFTTIHESLQAAEKKIKKFLAKG